MQETPEHLHQRGMELIRNGQAEAALECFQLSAARETSPERARARVVSGCREMACSFLGRRDLDEAEFYFDLAIQADPHFHQARFERSLLYLMRGDFARGWPEHEHRPQAILPHRLPRWRGEESTETILLRAEQGFGDIVQFVRYAPLVRRRVRRVVLACPAALHRLLETCPGIDELTTDDADAGATLQCPLLSLPHVFGATLETIPAAVPYLSACGDRMAAWRDVLDRVGQHRVGISWHGNSQQAENARRSFPLSSLEPLASVEGIHLISLQKGSGLEQAEDAPFAVFAPPGLDEGGDAFTDTAAIMNCLDLVVTCDTAIAHLAGALGVRVWLALSHAADWRWMIGRDDSPWYPSMRLFRQTVLGDWSDVFRRMANELKSGPGHVPQ